MSAFDSWSSVASVVRADCWGKTLPHRQHILGTQLVPEVRPYQRVLAREPGRSLADQSHLMLASGSLHAAASVPLVLSALLSAMDPGTLPLEPDAVRSLYGVDSLAVPASLADEAAAVRAAGVVKRVVVLPHLLGWHAFAAGALVAVVGDDVLVPDAEWRTMALRVWRGAADVPGAPRYSFGPYTPRPLPGIMAAGGWSIA
jgi:hypothetical protein